MNIIQDTAQKLGDAFMHYVCIRLNFRSAIMRGDLPHNTTDICNPCCPANA